jgi:hypothetical protein
MASDFFHAVIMLRTELMGECGDTCRCIGNTWRSRGTGVGVQPSKSFACVRTFVPGVGPHSVGGKRRNATGCHVFGEIVVENTTNVSSCLYHLTLGEERLQAPVSTANICSA